VDAARSAKRTATTSLATMESQGASIDPVQGEQNDAVVESSGVVRVRDLPLLADAQTGLELIRPLHAPDSKDVRPARVRRALSQRWRLMAALVVCVLCFGAWRAFAGAVRAPTLEQSLSRHIARRGYTVDATRIVWLSAAPNWLGVRSALFSAKRSRELHDIYYADVRVSEQTVLDLYTLTNITRTSSADEDLLVGTRSFAAYGARLGAAYEALVMIDTRGEPEELTRNWPWYAKLQNAITNYQDSGRSAAFGVRRYNFESPVGTLALGVHKGVLHVLADGEPLVIKPRVDTPLVGAELVELERPQKGQPGLITWVVDTVRRVPAIGSGPIEWLEHAVFGVTDRVTRAYHEVVKTDTAAEVKQALSVTELPKAPTPPITQAASPAAEEAEPPTDIGWPPAPLKPQLLDKVQGEGVWLPIVNDPFVAANPDAPPLFHQTFIRVDAKRTYTRVYVTMWDPRQVQLGLVMGTKEPESATGETGNGVIPRDPFVTKHLVGAFNGGFQAMHGEFGMMAGKRVYLPPKPFAATVAVFEDGTTGLGSWPGPGRHAWDESFANSQIPENMLAMRQNLTTVVEGDKYNPWERWWWGAAPEWAGEQTYIHRSGLCVTKEGFLAYFWGESMGPDELGKAMLATRCARGMHLDMNGKHTGFEFYNPYTPDQSLPDLGRALRTSEFEGLIGSDTRAMRFRARLAVTTMSPLRFPRYLYPDPRDYFYLTRKPTLPGATLQREGAAPIAFSTRGMPNAGFPLAFARAQVPELGWLTRIDLTRAVPKPMADPALTRTLGYLTSAKPVGPVPAQAGSSLYASYVHGRLRAQIGRPPPGVDPLCTGAPLSEAPSALAALGVDDEGFLVYAQTTRAGALPELLRAAGITEAVALGEGRLLLQAEEGPRSVDGQAAPVADEATSLALMAETRPAARVLFDDVVPTPYRVWGGMQGQRVRYFPSHPARFKAPDATQ
jgi:hypothetical protein